jgi:hypothetical protein
VNLDASEVIRTNLLCLYQQDFDLAISNFVDNITNEIFDPMQVLKDVKQVVIVRQA